MLLALLFCSLSLRAENAVDNGAEAVDELVLLLQSQLSDARTRSGALATEIDTLNQTLNNSRAAYEQMTAELVTRDESILALRGELDAVRAQVQAGTGNQDELRDLATAVVDLEAAKRRLEDENTIMQGRIRDLQRDRKHAGGQPAAAREETELSDPAAGPQGRLAELEARLEDMRDVEAQRKETMDDLFRQLAELRRARETDREKLELLEAERDIAREETGLVRAELAAGEKALQDRQRELEELQESVQAERDRQQTLSGQVAAKVADLEQAAADYETLQGRMHRLTGTDEQRRRAMDELLIRLATLEDEVRHTQDLLTAARRERDAALEESAGLKAELDRARSVHEQTVGGMEQALKTALAARDELAERVGSHDVEARRLTAQVEALEAEVARFRALDSQRRATMDSLMLDLAQAQDRSQALATELEALQSEPTTTAAVPDPARIENLQSQILVLETEKRDLQRALDTAAIRVQEDPAGLPAPDAALQAGLTELHAENERLRQDLEAQRRQVEALGDADRQPGDRRTDAPHASAMLREEWERERSEMNVRIKQLSLQRERDEADLRQFREAVDDLRADNTRLRAEVDQLQRVKADIQRDSDLFRSIEQANIELREKAAESDAERMRAQRMLAEIEAQSATLVERFATGEKDVESLRHALTVASERDAEQRELIEMLMVQMPALEEQVSSLDRVRSELEATLAERNNALDTLRVELDKREHRLQQAERVAQVLEQTREEVSRSAQRERRDMHYNMAAVYAREGRFKEAETEYLRALELDPADADVHYNLGILYDDELRSPERATLHYRRYLRLRPHGEDADAVRNWLRRIEMAPAGR